MKNKIKICLFLIFIIIAVSAIYGCAGGRKYFTELKASYIYDKDNGIFKKFPSELKWEPDEILSYNPEDKKTTILEYETLTVTLPKKNNSTGEFSDYKITMAYTVYNNKLIFTEVPIQYAPHEYFVINNSIDSVIVTIDDENAFLVNLNDGSLRKLYDDNIHAKTLSIEPAAGDYLLYLSDSDIYSYDIQTGKETKIMNFENKEFLCWSQYIPGTFLFREITSKNGKKFYSDIKSYNIASSTEHSEKFISEEFKSYEMIDDRYYYATAVQTKENGVKETLIYIGDIYSEEILTVNVGKYSMIWHIAISESKEYIAFFGSYINSKGIAIPEIVTVNTATNVIIPQYEQSNREYFIDSFSWCPDNVLAINFLNTADLYKDLCRLHYINH